jgi:hypothetical protein
MRRLRAAEWIAGAGGAGLLVALWLDWYSSASAWRAFAVLDVALALAALVPLALVVLQATRESPALPSAFSALTFVAGALATLLILYRILDPPVPGVEHGAWIGLAAAVVAAAGGWRSLGDETHHGTARPSIEDLPAPLKGDSPSLG